MKPRHFSCLLLALSLLGSCSIPLSNSSGAAVVRIAMADAGGSRFLAAETSKYRVTIQPEKGDKVNRSFLSDTPIVVEIAPGTATIAMDVFDTNGSLLTHGEVTQDLVSGPNEISLILLPARTFENEKAFPLLAHQLAYFQLNNDGTEIFGAEVGSSNNKAMFWPLNDDGTWDPNRGGPSGGVDVKPGDHLIVRVLQGDENGFVGAKFGPPGFGNGGGNSGGYVLTSDIYVFPSPSTLNPEQQTNLDLKFWLTSGATVDSVYFDGNLQGSLATNSSPLSLRTDGVGNVWVGINGKDAAATPGPHRVLVVFTDGQDNYWSYQHSLTIVAGQTLSASISGSVNAVIKPDGTLWTWVDPSPPARVGNEFTWKSVSVGGDFFTALKNDGTAWAWGGNTHGQLGMGDATVRPSPVQLPGFGGPTMFYALAAGFDHTLMVANGGGIWSTGRNDMQQLDTDSGATPSAYQLTSFVVGVPQTWKVVAGKKFSFALFTNQTITGWGQNDLGQLGYSGVGVSKLHGAFSDGGLWWRDVAAGTDHVVALRDEGSIWTWGGNSQGQLGLGMTGTSGTPQKVTVSPDPQKPWLDDRSWEAVAAGELRSWAVRRDGTLWAWGQGWGNKPVALGTETDWHRVWAGGDHALIQKMNGSLWRWGAGDAAPTQVFP